jgi:hypothetical protein
MSGLAFVPLMSAKPVGELRTEAAVDSLPWRPLRIAQADIRKLGGFALEAHRRSPLAATDMLQNFTIMNIEASV